MRRTRVRGVQRGRPTALVSKLRHPSTAAGTSCDRCRGHRLRYCRLCRVSGFTLSPHGVLPSESVMKIAICSIRHTLLFGVLSALMLANGPAQSTAVITLFAIGE